MNLIIRNCVIALFDLKEVGGDFRFCSFDHILDRILVFCTKKISVFWFGVCCGLRFLFYFALAVFGLLII